MSIAFERGRVAAETLAGLAWPLVEDVSEAATADRARDLDTVHSSVVPHPAHRYEPVTLLEYVAPVNGLSVPLRRSMFYCAGVGASRYSCSLFSTRAVC